MNASELKYQVENHNVEAHFFDYKTMRFFGDTMRNYGVREAEIVTSYNAQDKYIEGGITVKVWELYRRHAVKHGLNSSAYFDKQTFARIYPKV
jgi:hypothetical protein